MKYYLGLFYEERVFVFAKSRPRSLDVPRLILSKTEAIRRFSSSKLPNDFSKTVSSILKLNNCRVKVFARATRCGGTEFVRA